MAEVDNDNASQIDKTSFWWTGLCGICHPGGGPSEFDRDGNLYYDVATGAFGYEPGAADDFDGDYGDVSNQTGAYKVAPWDVTGVLEADCLYCHRVTRHADLAAGKNFDWIFRAATLRGREGLTTADGLTSIPAFAAAPTAAQGWADVVPAAGISPPKAASFDFNYGKGVADTSLLEQTDGTLKVNPAEIQASPADLACWGCHVIADDKKRGRVWFDANEDVHFGAFNNRYDGNPTTDIPNESSTACAYCHPVTGTPQNAMEHNFAKGNANLGSARNDTDYYEFNSCRECHVDGADPDATTPVDSIHTPAHLAAMACQFCHIPFKRDNASLAIDNATTGSTIDYSTDVFLTSNQVDPTLGDTSRWYPSAGVRADSDGAMRLFPDKLLLSVWWGDWNDNGNLAPDAGEVVGAIYLWKVRGIVASAGLTATDDNGDGRPEVNTLPEIQTYLLAIQGGNDQNGQPLVQNKAVLVKGGYVYYLNGSNEVQKFEIHGSGVEAESEHPFSIDHNVLPLDQGVTLGTTGCGECHTFSGDADVFERSILIDMSDETAESSPGAGDGAQPIYSSLQKVSGVDPND